VHKWTLWVVQHYILQDKQCMLLKSVYTYDATQLN